MHDIVDSADFSSVTQPLADFDGVGGWTCIQESYNRPAFAKPLRDASQPPAGDASHNDRPAPSRMLSEGYTHVFNPRPTDKPSSASKLSGAAAPSSSKARTHCSFDDATTPFYSGLEWLLDATKQSERAGHPPCVDQHLPKAALANTTTPNDEVV
ncbi:hypothetical protein Q7P37_010934 [Cladosporium fusiforme]